MHLLPLQGKTICSLPTAFLRRVTQWKQPAAISVPALGSCHFSSAAVFWVVRLGNMLEASQYTTLTG